MLSSRRQFLATTATVAAIPILAGWSDSTRVAMVAADKSWRGYADTTVIDALGGPGQYGADPALPLTPKMLDDIRLSGLSAVNLTVSGVGSYSQDYDKSIANIAYWNDQIAAHPDRLMLIRSATDIASAKASNRLGLIYGFQDTTPLFEDEKRLEQFDQLGVRVIQLTYNIRNLVGDGCTEPGDAGLSRYGRRLVGQINERGMLIDLSHSGRRTALEAIAASSKPVAITHTGCAALTDLPRNKTDAELKALADKGGVAGIYLMPFLRK
ncbi:MAG: membrane dipeptidase, partial [Dokdonella sp.]